MIYAFVLGRMVAQYRRFGTTISPTFKDCLIFGEWADRLVRNVCTELIFYTVIILNKRSSQACCYSLVLTAVTVKGCYFSKHHVPPSRPANPTGCKTLEELVMELSVLDCGTWFWRNCLSVGICYWNGKRTGIKYTSITLYRKNPNASFQGIRSSRLVNYLVMNETYESADDLMGFKYIIFTRCVSGVWVKFPGMSLWLKCWLLFDAVLR
jgi:hypothetical protein